MALRGQALHAANQSLLRIRGALNRIHELGPIQDEVVQLVALRPDLPKHGASLHCLAGLRTWVPAFAQAACWMEDAAGEVDEDGRVQDLGFEA